MDKIFLNSMSEIVSMSDEFSYLVQIRSQYKSDFFDFFNEISSCNSTPYIELTINQLISLAEKKDSLALCLLADLNIFLDDPQFSEFTYQRAAQNGSLESKIMLANEFYKQILL